MPNWCEGVLKVRGTKDKVLEFLHNGIAYCDYKYSFEDDKLIEIEVPRDCPIESGEYTIFIENTRSLWVKGTRRMFVNSDTIEHYWNGNDIDIVCIDVKQAWSILSTNLQELSKTYGLDFRIFATESGMQFCQLVEVIDGEITKDKTYEFNDFEWEVPDNRLGG